MMRKTLFRTLLLSLVLVAGFRAEASVTQADSVASTAYGGRMMWVPDSLVDAVGMLMKGHSKVVDDDTRLDLSEKVIFRRDTLEMVKKDRKLGRFDRGLYNFLFIPRGQWRIGLTASYGEISTKDMEMFDVMTDLNLSGSIFSVKPYFSYTVRNNLAVGMRLGYTTGTASLGSLGMDIMEDMNVNLHDIYYRNESYTAAVTLTQFYGLARRGRFAVFNEVELAFSSGNSDFNRPFGGEMKKTHSTNMKASLNFSPGVSVLVMKNVSFNVSFGVFGFYLKNENQSVDGEKAGNRFTSGANFRFNIFNINFGIGVHI